ncbi:MAG: hypothetical protein PHY05_11870, partial [Methanothrix sp.]|nr:hypothetical protein [Methanothrix sp.]
YPKTNYHCGFRGCKCVNARFFFCGLFRQRRAAAGPRFYAARVPAAVCGRRLRAGLSGLAARSSGRAGLPGKRSRSGGGIRQSRLF